MEQEVGKSTDSSGIIGPLNFSKESFISVKEQLYPSAVQVPCLLCSKTFTFYSEKHDYLAHLYLNHRLIIGDEDQVAIFHEYLSQWHKIFMDEKQPLDKFCTTLLMNQLPDGKPSKDEKYYLLCDVSQKDLLIRQKLQKQRLDLVLAQHQFERTDHSFERDCLFCRDVLKPTRYAYIEHMFSKHFFQVGKAANLVFISDLIDLIQMNLRELKCIFCEKTFKDRPTLKEHMRKKGHKRINPENKNFDRFFLINYRNPHQEKHCRVETTQQKKKPNTTKDIPEDDNDSNWSDWEEDEVDITCLFCERKSKDFTVLKEHIKTDHSLDFERESKKLSFYDRVKMVNFVRRAMYKMECIKCGTVWNDMEQFRDHLNANNHYSLGESKHWNFPQYLFPTYEDDAMLCHLDDLDEEQDNAAAENAENDPSIVVYSEDTSETISLDPAIAKMNIL